MKPVWLLAAVLLCPGTPSYAGAQAPGVRTFKPTSGPVGTWVTIRGKNFDAITEVTFGGASAQGKYTSGEIIVQVPPDATTGPIQVYSVNGLGTSAEDFVVVDAPAPVPTPTPDAPIITSAKTVHATQDQPFTYRIEADRPVSSYTSVYDAPDLQLDRATGIISGTPTSSGTYHTQIGAVDASGNRGTADLTIVIATDEPTVTLSAAPRRIVTGDGQTAVFTVNLSRPAPRALYISYYRRGTLGMNSSAVPSLNGTVEVPAGATSVRIPAAIDHDPMIDRYLTGVQTLKLVLQQFPGGYRVGKPNAAKIKIVYP